MKGKFIVIEGIDGCGKTTQIDELSKWLPNSGLIKKGSKLITTREPGGSLLGKKLRGLILENNENNKPSSLAELLLYSADRAEHVSKIISPALNNNDWVISDRFSDSTLAYQGYGRNINLDVSKIKMPLLGSSKVFKRLFEAASFKRCASIIKTIFFPEFIDF